MSNTALFTNNAATVLAAAISTTLQTTITVASGTGGLFPSPSAGQFFPITLTPLSTPNGPPWEILYCTTRTGDVLTVLRGQEGTTPTTWAVGDNVAMLITAGVLNNFVQSPANVGRLLNVQTITSSGTYTPTSGTNSVVVYLQAAGGAGGGTPSLSGTNAAAAGGGAAGALSARLITSGFSGVTVTLGAPGSGATGADGGNAAASSFGSIFSVDGGSGAPVAVAASVAENSGGAGQTATPTGGNVLNIPGAGGNWGFYLGVSNLTMSGNGASSAYGSGGVAKGGSSNGGPGTGYGAGGAGAATNNAGPGSGVAYAGGNGAPAICIVYEYS